MAVLEPKKNMLSHTQLFFPHQCKSWTSGSMSNCVLFLFTVYIYMIWLSHMLLKYIYILLLHTPSWYQIMGYIHISFYWLYIISHDYPNISTSYPYSYDKKMVNYHDIPMLQHIHPLVIKDGNGRGSIPQLYPFPASNLTKPWPISFDDLPFETVIFIDFTYLF